jgi:hypothetical protein
MSRLPIPSAASRHALAGRLARSLRPALGAFALALVACGGVPGAGGGAQPAALVLDGDYHFQMTRANSTPEFQTHWGVVQADAATFAGTMSSNWNGTVSGPGPMGPVDYAIGADRSITWSVGGIEVAEGGVSSDGDLAVFGFTVASMDPSIAWLGRREGTYGTSSLSGEYHFLALRRTVGFGFTVSFWGTIDFDGAGSATLPTYANSDGLVLGPVTYTPTYSVLADGTVHFDLTGTGYEMEGGVIEDGDVVFVNGTSAAGSPTTIVMIRKGVGLDVDDLAGRYFAVGLELDLATMRYRSATGTLEADGAGNGVLALVENDEGIVAAAPTENVVYAVATNGAMTLLASGTSFRGGVSPTGEVAAVAGGEVNGDDPRLLIFVR